MNKQISRVWTFASDSNPQIEYQTLQYTDGSTSCDCKGWTRRVVNGTRSCKHTRYVDLGTAERHCKATHSYQQTERKNAKSNKSSYQIPRLGVRRFAV